MSQYNLVIARYNEDINWLNNIQNTHRIFLYNKGDDDIYLHNVYIEKLKNVGREAHTYITHIINNYDNLGDITIFCQGRIDDHLPDGINDVNIFFHKLYLEANNNGISNPPLTSYNLENFRLGYWAGEHLESANMTFKDWFIKYISCKWPNILLWYPFSIMGVRKDFILSKSKAYYERLLTTISSSRSPEEGHFFERSWFYIFGHYLLPN